MNMLIFKTIDKKVLLKVAKNKEFVLISIQSNNREEADEIAKFKIDEVWDMLKTALINSNPNPCEQPGLYRRKSEATSATTYTNIFFGGK